MDGHSGEVPPDPISNSEVKIVDVSGSTTLSVENQIRCPPFLFNYTKSLNILHIFLIHMKNLYCSYYFYY